MNDETKRIESLLERSKNDTLARQIVGSEVRELIGYIEKRDARISALESELADMTKQRNTSIERLVELSEPGSIGAFARRDHEIERAARLESELAEARAEIAKLREIVGKLPKTADGVPVVPDMTVWWDGGRARDRTNGTCVCNEDAPSITLCYSTRAAAEAANGGRK